MPFSWKRAIVILISIGFLYLIGVFYIYVFIDRVIFFPKKLSKSYVYKIDKNYSVKKIFHPNEEFIEALYFNHETDSKKGVVLYLHDANESVEYWSKFVHTYTNQGFDVLLPDYRGFGKSNGTTNEFNIYQDALSSYYALEKMLPQDSILIYGVGMGAVAAAHVGSQTTPRMIILENPLIDIRSWIKNRYRALVIYRELKYDFKLSDYLPQCQSASYIIYSNDDNRYSDDEISNMKSLLTDGKSVMEIKHKPDEDITEQAEYKRIIELLFKNF